MTPALTQERFLTLFDQHQGIVFKVAGTYAWQPDDRRELIQEITAQLWRAFPSYDASRPFPTWMYRVALNVAISYVRQTGLRRKRFVSIEEHDVDPIDPASQRSDDQNDERVQTLRQFMSELDVLNRALLLLYLEEHNYKDIAEALGLSETNVATKLSRLKQRLRKELAS